MPTLNELGLEAPVDRGKSTAREFDILDVVLIVAARKPIEFLDRYAQQSSNLNGSHGAGFRNLIRL